MLLDYCQTGEQAVELVNWRPVVLTRRVVEVGTMVVADYNLGKDFDALNGASPL